MEDLSFAERIRHFFDRPVYGLQEFNEAAIPFALTAIHRADKQAYIIPAGFWGDNNIIQPNKVGQRGGHITLRAFGAGVGSMLGLPLAHFSHVRLGVGIREDELDLKNKYPDLKYRHALNEEIARQVATQLPYARRGKFKDKV